MPIRKSVYENVLFYVTVEQPKQAFLNEVTIHTLPHFKCIRLISMRSSNLPFKMHYVGFRAFKSALYYHRRANRTDRLNNDIRLGSVSIGGRKLSSQPMGECLVGYLENKTIVAIFFKKNVAKRF